MKQQSFKLYKVYMLRCRDNSLYSGSTDCLSRRLAQHLEKQGAKYTRRGIEDLVYVSFHVSRNEALKEERRLKKLSKKAKEQLVRVFKFN